MIDLAKAQEANAHGMAALRAGDHAAAAAAFGRATTADPTAIPLWSNLAHAYRLAGDGAGERFALERALSIDRTDFGPQLRMAQLLQRLGEETAALQAWSGAFQLAAQMPALAPAIEAEIAAGRAYCDALQGRIESRLDVAFDAVSGEWDECEKRRINAFVDRALGKRAIYTNECAGLQYPFLPADEFFDRLHFDWLDQLEAGAGVVRAELDALLASPGEVMRPYVRMDEGTPQNLWSALDHSLDWSACFLWEYGAPNQPILDRCPQTAALLERLPLARIPGRAPNAFFSLLRPHTRIPPHTGVTNTRAILHLALDIPPGCGFRVGGETREWVEGKAFAFDDTIEHEAWNDSDRRRAVLIIDTWNPHLTTRERDAIVRYTDMADHALATPQSS
ncbi:aspartyl/asparaginyl beta-hydroxylase domain-containing protein [Novosphingobium sp.]|uniref:aspartyl/asparaginyl beta-hydroxylase domain-containing protein n=1 Tax=Novosphingobium sp. TaxID=1874826 RepID=UPI0025E9CAAD|nr:aspartyl/asparaginyl beta-hydroxylase domain-containing protein [Novosphingobium sp.]